LTVFVVFGVVEVMARASSPKFPLGGSQLGVSALA
jgi:hypothetical protein